MKLSNRVKILTPSSTLAISAKAQELKRQGEDVIGLGVGEPDFNTPEYIIKAAKKAMDDGMTKYTASSGIIELREAIQQKFRNDNNLSYDADEIIVTTGAKHALYTVFQAILEQGDEVIIPTPFWVSYTEQVKLSDGVPVLVQTEEKNDFKLTAKQLEEAITERTKAIVINSPSNPTGMMYTKEELKAIGEVCLKHNIIIVSDEIYEKLIYTGEPHVSIAEISPQLKALTIVINGVSKSHAMTGWRIGYAAGPRHLIAAMTNHASHATSNPTTVAQYATLAAYTEKSASIEQMKDVFSERLDTLYKLLQEIPGVTLRKPHGAFYLFPNVTEAVKNNGFTSVDEWVKALLEEEKVALVPGSAFGAPNNVRLSYATSTDLLIEAAKRIKRFVINHQK
ncbi:MAG TPA: pyridoxal phosphate-dependent aminotransferase [Bacillota bacterium]|nr:pyridoxal phosphate-dependent aminotransferase [Bacillota bacterium]